MRSLLSVIAVVSLAAPAFAAEERSVDDPSAEHPIDKRFGECIEKDSSTSGMIECIEAARAEWDDELNASYQALMKRLPAPALVKLRDAQRAWLKFRDLEVESIGETFDGFEGTMFRTMSNDAVLVLTKDRANQLAAVLEAAKLASGAEP